MQPTLQKLNSYALLPSLHADTGPLMDRWAPGRPVLTAQDHTEWLSWRKERKRQQQRDRRAGLRRIDYHASRDVAAALDLLWRPKPGGDYSSIIDGIVRDWLGDLPPE